MSRSLLVNNNCEMTLFVLVLNNFLVSNRNCFFCSLCDVRTRNSTKEEVIFYAWAHQSDLSQEWSWINDVITKSKNLFRSVWHFVRPTKNTLPLADLNWYPRDRRQSVEELHDNGRWNYQVIPTKIEKKDESKNETEMHSG